jgi:acyl dehydratase
MSGPALMLGDSAHLSREVRAGDLAALRQLSSVGAQEAELADGAAGEMLVCAMWSTLLGVHLPGPGTNYLKQESRFLAPIPADAMLTAEVTITRIRADKGLVDLATRCTGPDGTLLAEGRALVQARDTGRLAGP